MRTSVETLEGNRVKLSVEVEEAEFERELDAAFRRIARDVRIPGFRPGKAPRRLLEARLGPDVARQEALRESLPVYYARAVNEEAVDVIAPPEIDITAGQTDGAVVFDAVVEVRPRITVPGYGGLRVELPRPEVSDEQVEASIDRLRQQQGTLNPVERPARTDDFVRLDIAGSLEGEPVEGLTADDYLHRVGSEAVVPELDAHLLGAKLGDILVFDAQHPDEEIEEPLSFRILVKDVQEQVLPDADDAWAGENSEFTTVADLRSDLRTRLEAAVRRQAAVALQEATLASLVSLVDEDPPEAMVKDEVERRGRDFVGRLNSQGTDLGAYLSATGLSPGELSEQLREAAVHAVKADLGLRSVAEHEQLEVDDDELDDELETMATSVGQTSTALRRTLQRNEQLGSVRSELRKSKALRWLVERAEIVDPDGHPIDRNDFQPSSEDDDTGEPGADDTSPDRSTAAEPQTETDEERAL